MSELLTDQEIRDLFLHGTRPKLQGIDLALRVAKAQLAKTDAEWEAKIKAERERIIKLLKDNASQVVISCGQDWHYELNEKLPNKYAEADYIEVHIHPNTELWNLLNSR